MEMIGSLSFRGIYGACNFRRTKVQCWVAIKVKNDDFNFIHVGCCSIHVDKMELLHHN